MGRQELLEAGLDTFADTFSAEWRRQALAKIGLEAQADAGEDLLVAKLLGILTLMVDTTLFFRQLMECIAREIAGECSA